ncbi:GDSL family lipase [Hymenobacter sp. UV11]|uniref:GDSL-type esterase/lipase family protein n=1 Tax=Hymenobacter sp. UV11 TaxID=1849735 RepID=UPI00105DF82B|nr:GDSL-type esterase/lipase family protein [Hymenobacter sp. UV11]TDN39101.1 hypothetical protein A8B98_21685 [Hymenobacter sp. UV11]TFZ65811.1 GDSL family lipase [Hymenobacter sp. UV11]
MQWYQDEIARLARQDTERHGAQPKVVFYGSSTFTRWPELAQGFPQVQAVNMGFGGATLAACAWFFEQVVVPHRPDALLLYAGDNDLSDGRNPEEVVLFYEHLLASVAATLGPIPVCFVAIKLSPARLHLRGSIDYANACIRQRAVAAGKPLAYLDFNVRMLDAHGHPQPALFEADGLHLSAAGYTLWQQEIGTRLDQIFPPTAA